MSSSNYYMRQPYREGGGSNNVSRGYHHQSSSRRGERSRDRSLDIHDMRKHHGDQRDMNGEARRRSGDGYHHHSSSRYRSYDDKEPRASGNRYQASSSRSRCRSRDRSVAFDDEHHAPQRSQSCGPHSRYPSSSRDDYYHQEHTYTSQFRKRWRSPDSSSQNVQQNDERVNRSRRQKGIGEGPQQQDTSYERRPLGPVNGAEMQMQRPAPHPMTSNGSQRNDNDATLSLGRNGVNNMSSHHHYHHPMDASQHHRPLVSSNGQVQVRMPAPQFNKINTVSELIQAAYSSLSALSLSPSDTAAFWNSLAKQLGRNNQLNLSYEQMGSYINQLFEHTRRTLEMFGPMDLSQTIYSMAKLVELLRKRRSDINHRKDNIASSLSNLLLNDDGRIREQSLFPCREDLFLSLANASVRKMDQFGAWHISNLAYAYALIRFVPVLADGSDLFHQVAKTAIQRKEDFISQEVANLLWSYATLGIIDKQLFSSFAPTAAKFIDSYNNQNLGNIAWAYAVADVDAPTLFNDRFINKCLEKGDGFSIADLRQLHQWHLWQTIEKSNVGLPEALQDICYNAFISRAPCPSKFQDDVVSQLSSIRLNPKEEVLMESGYRIDAIVEVDGKTIGVEVDGPSHFIGKGKSPLAKTILKRRQVPLIDGIDLISVPYWKWDKLGNSQTKKQDYLRKLLNL